MIATESELGWPESCVSKILLSKGECKVLADWQILLVRACLSSVTNTFTRLRCLSRKNFREDYLGRELCLTAMDWHPHSYRSFEKSFDTL